MFRRLQLLILAVVLIVAAFTTGCAVPVLPDLPRAARRRRELHPDPPRAPDLEAGYAVSQLSGHVGDRLRVTYTLRNTGRLQAVAGDPQPDDAAGRAAGTRAEPPRTPGAPLARAHAARPARPLPDRAAADPTGDPFGFFEASASVGQGITLVVYPS